MPSSKKSKKLLIKLSKASIILSFVFSCSPPARLSPHYVFVLIPPSLLHLLTNMVSRAKKKNHLCSSNHLLLPPSMKDFASCFSDHAVKVSDTSCSGSSSSSGGNSSVVDNAAAVLTAVTCVYLARLSSKRNLAIAVTWSRGYAVALPSLSVAVDGQNPINCRKKKGSRIVVSGNLDIELHWDISSANYGSGPEPTDGFCLVVALDSQVAVWIGEPSEESARRFEAAERAECSMICRTEKVIGDAPHTTRARFRAGGGEHEIAIGWRGIGWDANESELSVAVDKKRVVHVRSLRWNFRGNQTIFVDGSPVDMMWDVHDWWFGCGGGGGGGGSSRAAVFMFRARSSLESRLWLEDEVRGAPGFSLLIQASKS